MYPQLTNLPYGTLPRQCGDLFLPPTDANTQPSRPPVLLIHGGGWKSMSKEALAPVAKLALAAGFPVYSVNYRLLGAAPWPACGEDCLLAANFLLDGGLARYGQPGVQQIIVCGASAGGHLALMTALQLPTSRVRAVISMAGPSRIYPKDDDAASAICGESFLNIFFGNAAPIDHDTVCKASPIHCIHGTPPPLICIHSTNDRLVPFQHSLDAVHAWQQAGAAAQLLSYDGPGDKHGFWDSDALDTRQLIPPVQRLLNQALAASSAPAR